MNIMFANFIECISRGLATYATYPRNTFSDETNFCVIYLSLLTSQRYQVCKGGSGLLMLWVLKLEET